MKIAWGSIIRPAALWTRSNFSPVRDRSPETPRRVRHRRPPRAQGRRAGNTHRLPSHRMGLLSDCRSSRPFRGKGRLQFFLRARSAPYGSGFATFIQAHQLTLECHDFEDINVPEDFRDLSLSVQILQDYSQYYRRVHVSWGAIGRWRDTADYNPQLPTPDNSQTFYFNIRQYPPTPLRSDLESLNCKVIPV